VWLTSFGTGSGDCGGGALLGPFDPGTGQPRRSAEGARGAIR